MLPYKSEFIELSLEIGALKFGQFTLKSGRVSPYFFNSGLFNTGYAVAKLCRYYAAAVDDSDIEFDMLFGPAYKGIPLVALTAAALAEHHDYDVPFSFNRKEIKTHGEGGSTIGSPIEGRVLVIDDVITAGTAIKETAELIHQAGAEVAGVVIAVDRQERGSGEQSAVQEVQDSLKAPVASIIQLEDLIEHLETSKEDEQFLPVVADYMQRYGV